MKPSKSTIELSESKLEGAGQQKYNCDGESAAVGKVACVAKSDRSHRLDCSYEAREPSAECILASCMRHFAPTLCG